MPDLTDTERTILAIEARWYSSPGAKEAAVRQRLDLSMTAYLLRLNALLDNPAAEAADPHTVRRLRRLRSTRQRARDARTA